MTICAPSSPAGNNRAPAAVTNNCAAAPQRSTRAQQRGSDQQHERCSNNTAGAAVHHLPASSVPSWRSAFPSPKDRLRFRILQPGSARRTSKELNFPWSLLLQIYVPSSLFSRAHYYSSASKWCNRLLRRNEFFSLNKFPELKRTPSKRFLWILSN